jgi:hypothetical protein
MAVVLSMPRRRALSAKRQQTHHHQSRKEQAKHDEGDAGSNSTSGSGGEARIRRSQAEESVGGAVGSSRDNQLSLAIRRRKSVHLLGGSLRQHGVDADDLLVPIRSGDQGDIGA